MNKLLIPLLAMAFIGCASFNNNAGKLLASTALTVDTAMRDWATYVVVNNVPADKQVTVKNAYAQYQLAMSSAESAYAAVAGGADQSVWQKAAAALTAASSSLTALIQSFTTPIKP